MIDQLKHNTRIKLISLLSAVVLWMYVMAVVDPEETKLFEDIPVEITNMNQLADKDLVIYPEVDLTTDIAITGKLSNLQKVNKNNIHIYGEINNLEGNSAGEGNNQIYLKASVPGKVTHEFKSGVLVVNLEKLVKEKRAIEVNVEGKARDNIEPVTMDKDSVRVSGPRVLVNKVQKVVATLNVGDEVNDSSKELSLVPVDENGKKVEGIHLDSSKVTVNVKFLKQKTVPINVKFSNNSQVEENLKDYTISQKTITIKGKKDIVDSIDAINTKPVDLSSITEDTSKDIYLEIPEGISVEFKYITIKLDAVKYINSNLTYASEDVELRNLSDTIDMNKVKVPGNIKVSIEHGENIDAPTKSDIVLYIDFNESPSEDGGYFIKYETKYDAKQIIIEPNVTSI
ncbi:CdaR family protein [[Clostridium] dakarense]|uniref:CdaR family protein n=1 Tax=Faecalimicrobium dakarense TaxID=1301100 RepID=UPI0004AF4851|nr:CdaR family protein [[Clostridium] dakarense]